MKTDPETRIYVALLGEGVDVWRPVRAKQVDGDRFLIVAQHYDRDMESWEFEPGSTVRVEKRKLSEGECLVAVSSTAKAMTVEDFENPEGVSFVRWRFRDGGVSKRYGRAVPAVKLASDTGVLIVEDSGYPNNAVIYNADGLERVRVENPDPQNGGSSFVDAYYVGAELTLILGFSGGQTAVVVDESGNTIRTYETR